VKDNRIDEAFVLPEIIWNWEHQFVSFRHLMDLSSIGEFQVQVTSMSKNVVEYVAGQVLLFSPFFIPFFVKRLIQWGRRIRKQDVVGYLLGTWFGVFLFFLLLSPNGVYINWTLFAYAPLPVVFGYAIFQQGSFRKVAWAWMLTLFFQVVALNPALLDVAGVGSLYPPKKDAVKRMVGWQGISRHVEEILPENSSYFVFSDNYHVASEMAFYLNQPARVFCINEGRRMNQFLMVRILRFDSLGCNCTCIVKNWTFSFMIFYKISPQHGLYVQLIRDCQFCDKWQCQWCRGEGDHRAAIGF